MRQAVVYIHGKGGNAQEAEHYRPLFPDHDIIGFDYGSETPQEAAGEFRAFLETVRCTYERIVLIAVSIGAYYALMAFTGEETDRAYFISPVTDMAALIRDMMSWAAVTEEELCRKKEIPVSSGETLSWDYLCYVRDHPVIWHIPASILCGQNDSLVSFDTVRRFAERTGSSLTVMPGGEHWFHTDEQMAFLDEWIRRREDDARR